MIEELAVFEHDLMQSILRLHRWGGGEVSDIKSEPREKSKGLKLGH